MGVVPDRQAQGHQAQRPGLHHQGERLAALCQWRKPVGVVSDLFHKEGGTMGSQLNIDLFCKVMSEIMSEKHGCKITYTAIAKNQAKKKEKVQA